jgi:hypothetical protein
VAHVMNQGELSPQLNQGDITMSRFEKLTHVAYSGPFRSLILV